MGKRVDQAVFDKLLEAYRLDPGNHSAAARHAAVTRRTAKHAWAVGYPDRPWGSKPIKDMLADETELARARVELEEERETLEEERLALEAEREREAARQNAIRAKEQEAQLISAARAGALLGLRSAVQAAPGLQKAMVRLGQELEDMSAQGKALTPKEVAQLSSIMRRYSSTLRELNAAGQISMEMERLFLGEPSKIIGVETEFDSMPLNELVKLAGYQDSVLRRAQERGLVVLEGGLTKKDGSG